MPTENENQSAQVSGVPLQPLVRRRDDGTVFKLLETLDDEVCVECVMSFAGEGNKPLRLWHRKAAYRMQCVCVKCMANDKDGFCNGTSPETCFERRLPGEPMNPAHLPSCGCSSCTANPTGQGMTHETGKEASRGR